MLRGRLETTNDLPVAPYPTGVEPFAVEDHPMGIAFYKGRESFFLPYALLESIRFQPDKITLCFASRDVVVQGHGLHALYLRLAEYKVARVVEQGDRCVDEGLVRIMCLEAQAK